jgi:hypothetical protein
MTDDITTTGVMASPEAQERAAREEGYSKLLACYRSGQIAEDEWTEHLLDEDFHAWLETLRR